MEDSAQRRWSGAVRGAIRVIDGAAGLVDERRRSPAKPDGLGGVVSLLNGKAVIFGVTDRGGFFGGMDITLFCK